MADENIVTNITANADFSGLISDLNRVTSSLSKLQEQLSSSNKMLANQVAQMNRSFADTLRSTGQYSTHFVTLTSDVEKFGRNLDSGKLKLRDYFRVYQEHTRTSGGLIRDLARQQVQLQNAVLQPLGRNAQGLMQFNVHVPRGLDEVKNKTSLAKQELQIFNKVIQDGGVQLINWGKNTQWAGRQLTVGLTVPLAAFGKAAADAFKTADQELTRLTKVYGGLAQTSSKDLAKVRDDVQKTARELSASYGVSFQETLALAGDIAATGKEGNELLGSIRETSRLAVLGEVDRQEAMKATLAIQTAFKSNTEELAESINFLNAVENQTSTTLQDLVEAIPKAGPIIKGLGGSVQDLALYLTAMREGGVSASEGANALKSALGSLINPTKVATEMFAGFGIDLKGIVAKNAGDVTATIYGLQEALDRLNPLQKQQALEQLFGKFQFARMNALFSNLGKQGSQTLQVLDLMKASSSDLANIAGRELTMVTESASGKYRRAIEELKADLAGIGEQFLNINTKVINFIDGMVDGFNKLPKPIKTVLSLVGGITAILGPIIMLTGVMANFFGYVIKGVSHFRALFRGGEGWKLLTPDILAAEKAGSLMEETFYSDAKAASILQRSLSALSAELAILEKQIQAGKISVAPVVNAAAQSVQGISRVVDPNHPLVGQPYTRASTHMVPRAMLSEEQRMQQTFLGLVPGAAPVNRRIGENPQIYMNEPLPDIAGLTRIGKTSTGVVAGEAARHHALMIALGMQSKQEINDLRKTIVATGTVSKDFMNTFDDILPAVTTITNSAATQSAAIVAELKAGTINLQQARQRIIELNLQIERELGVAATGLATARGRTINLTQVPTLNQPVVDPTGRSNMRELFKKGRSKDFIDRLARIFGVRTSGAGYNIETTRPRRMNDGGYVYTMNDGNIVPGPNINQDVVPAMLTPGEFVVNAEATRKNLPLLQAINGAGSNGPGYNAGSVGSVRSHEYETVIEPRLTGISSQEMASAFPDRFRGNRSSYRIRGTAGVYLNTVTDPRIVAKHPYLSTDGRSISVEAMNARMASGGLHYEVYEAAMAASKNRYAGSTDQLLGSLVENGIITDAEAKAINKEIDSTFRRDIRRQVGVRDANNRYWGISNRIIQKHLSNNSRALGFWNEFSSQPAYIVSESLRSSGEPMRSPSMELRKITHNGETIRIDPLKGKRGQSFFAHASTPTPLLQRLVSAGITVASRRALPFRFSRNINRNMGGMIPGYNAGGMVPAQNGQKYNRGGMVRNFILPSVGSLAGYQGGSALGERVGGDVGSMVGGTLGGMLPFMLMSRGMGGAGESTGRLTGIMSKLPGATSKVVFGITKLNIALAALTTAGIVAFKIFRDNQEQQRLSALSYGLTADAASKAGIKLTDFSGTIKTAVESQKAMIERNKLIYESTMKANTPLNITIEQYKKLKDQVKKTMPDIVKMFDKMDKKDVGAAAQRLKAQFISAGMSAEEATKKIFALIAVSNKGLSAAGAAIGSKVFGAINSKETAATASAGAFSNALKTQGTKEQSSAFFAALEGMDVNIADQMSKGKTALEAVENQFSAINEKTKEGTTLNSKLIGEIKKQVPELGAILNETDDINSSWAKYQLLIQGSTADLSKLTGEAAMALVKMNNVIANSIGKSLKESKGLEKSYKNISDIEGKIKNYKEAMKGQNVRQQISDRDRIKAINEVINRIKEEANERKKALQIQQQANDYNLQIQQEQLRYQQALATGNMQEAASAQINIQRLSSARQTQLAEQAIEDKAAKDITKEESKIKAIEDKQTKLGDTAALAAEGLETLEKRLDSAKTPLQNFQDALTKLAQAQALDPAYLTTKLGKEALAAITELFNKAGGDLSALGIDGKGKSTVDIGKMLFDKLGAMDSINANEVNLYAKEVKEGTSKGKPTKVQVSETSRGNYVSSSSVSAAGYSTAKGTKFPDSKGQMWEITFEGNAQTGGNLVVVKAKAERGYSGTGPSIAGMPILVGEKGPEIFVPNVNGAIVPNGMIPNLSPAFNIPTNSYTMASPLGNLQNQANNVIMNTTVNLNGTNLTKQDVVNAVAEAQKKSLAMSGYNRSR